MNCQSCGAPLKEVRVKKPAYIEHLPREVGSTDLDPSMADVILDNNGSLEDLKRNVRAFHAELSHERQR